MSIVVPATSTKEWPQSSSTNALAACWQGANGFPRKIKRMFKVATVPGINDAEMLFGVPTHTTNLPGRGGPPFADLFVLAKRGDGLITMIVEGKASQTFNMTIEKWLNQNKNEANRRVRLNGLCEKLEIEVGDVTGLRYGMLHRTAVAVIEAEQFSASTAVMLVHSFGDERKWFDVYAEFANAMGVSVEPGKLSDAGIRSGRRLFLGWLSDIK